jgi:uncharacterized membrane protein (UPF0127 family)
MTFKTNCHRTILLAVVATSAFAMGGCPVVPQNSKERNNLSSMRTTPITITGKTTFTSYIADTSGTQQLGLMNTTESELPNDRGMFFVFTSDRHRNFWMRNTIIPLDIAYIRSDGTIVKIYTMEPLNEIGYPSIEPARFALEVRAGQFAAHGVVEGDHVEIPASLLD